MTKKKTNKKKGDGESMEIDDADTVGLPENRFELELEFVQALASPAYVHFLATSRVGDGAGSGGTSSSGAGEVGGAGGGGSSDAGGPLLQDPAFQSYLKYLYRTWSMPQYARYLTYPHCLFFLELLTDEENAHVLTEWTLPEFRNFVHQQQFAAWQYRHATLYGQGRPTTTDGDNNNKKPNNKEDDGNGEQLSPSS